MQASPEEMAIDNQPVHSCTRVRRPATPERLCAALVASGCNAGVHRDRVQRRRMFQDDPHPPMPAAIVVAPASHVRRWLLAGNNFWEHLPNTRGRPCAGWSDERLHVCLGNDDGVPCVAADIRHRVECPRRARLDRHEARYMAGQPLST